MGHGNGGAGFAQGGDLVEFNEYAVGRVLFEALETNPQKNGCRSLISSSQVR
jgi:hypothetical protein